MSFFNIFKKVVKTTIKNAERQQVLTQMSNENIIRQLFETMQILLKTTNYNTYLSRLLLFDERIVQYMQIAKNRNFKNSYSTALSKYRMMYYDRHNTTIQIEKYLKNIENFDKDIFFEDTFCQFYKRLAKETEEKINLLKTEKAKQNKKEKFISEIETGLNFLREKGYSDTSPYFVKFKSLIQ